jgi:hypothetical protein
VIVFSPLCSIYLGMWLQLSILSLVVLGQVVPPNSNPTFVAGPDVSVPEDSGTYSAVWATSVSDGEGPLGTNSLTQSLAFTVVAADPSLFSTQPSIDTLGVLTFVPAPNAFGTTQVTVTLRDSGTSVCILGGNNAVCPGSCSPADCSASRTVTFQIIITPINDCPTFSIRGDQTVAEDSGQSSIVGFAYQVSQGAPNENTQTLTFTVTNNNNNLFQQQPSITWSATNPTSGTLVFTPAANAFGTATVTVSARDNGGTLNNGCEQSTTQTFSITVTPVNDPPTFTMGASPVTVLEDSGPATIAPWATGMNPGPSEGTQTLRFNTQFLDPTATSLFSVLPAIDATTGALTFTPAPNANTFGRSVQLYVQLQDNGVSSPLDVSCNPITACPVLTIQITPVNDAPSFIPGGDINVYEDLRNYAVPPVPPVYSDGNAWATQISVGAQNEGLGVNNEGQIPVFQVTNDNSGLFDVQPAIDSRGTLTFQLHPHANGVARVTAIIRDTGTPAATGNTATFLINVQSVNDPPTYVISYANPIVLQQNGPSVDIPVWATSVVRGPLDEQNQIASFQLTPDDPTFFSVQPTVSLTDSGTGRLQFRVAQDRWGTQKVRVVLKDDGGVLRNGVDFSVQTLTIMVNFVNQVPSFLLTETTINVYESATPPAYSRGGFAYNISAGGNENIPGTSSNLVQTVRFRLTTNNEHLFSTLPSIDSNGRLTFQQAPREFGDATVTVLALDDNLPPGVSAASTFVVHIIPVNNPPTFTLGADIVGRQLSMCTIATACARTFPRFLTSLSVGPVNEASQGIVSLAADIQPQFSNLFTVPPAINRVTGDLTFTMAQYKYTDPSNPIVVTVTVKDDGGVANGGVDTTVASFKLEILQTNLPPSFNPGADVTVLEDSGRYVATGWARSIQKSPSDTSSAGLVFVMNIQDTTLFTDPPRLTLDTGNTATLTFTPAPDRYGSSLVQITLNNPTTNQNSDQFTITITITPVNDAPSFTVGKDIVVYQNSGSYFSPWATMLSPGPYEDRQTLTTSITCDRYTLFSINPTLDTFGNVRFVLATGASGVVPCRAILQDNGGILNGGVDTSSQPFMITVVAKNNAPSFVAGNDLTVLENSGTFTSFAWATQITAGTGDSGQQLRFEITSTDDTVFAVPPRINVQSGTLTFTLATGANGNVHLNIVLVDDGPTTGLNINRSPAWDTFLIITPVNSAPKFTLGSNLVLLQNSGLFLQKGWATQIAAGPDNEAFQTLRFTLIANVPQMFALPPRLDPATGDLQFSLATNNAGLTSISTCLIDNGGTANGGVDTTCQTFSVSILAVNQAPNAVLPPTVTIVEDFGPYMARGFLTGVSTGAGSGESQQLITQVSATIRDADRSAFLVEPTISLSDYSLSFTMAADWFGQVVVTVTLKDNGGVANGGQDTTVTTFTIIVLPVNDAPTFTTGGDIAVDEDSGSFNRIWASSISPGPANEVAQSVTFSTTNNRNDLFAVQPVVDSLGYLTFRTAKDVNGVADCSIILMDNGGVANGGVDRTLSIKFQIRVKSVNDPPTFDCDPAIATVEDSAPVYLTNFAKNVKAGPTNDEILTQSNLTFSVRCDSNFFAVLPTVAYPSGDLAFTLAPDRWGTTTITIVLNDNADYSVGGPMTSARTVTLTIAGVNDPPNFRVDGDISILEDAGDQVFKDYVKSISPGSYEDDQTVSMDVSTMSPAFFASQPRILGTNLALTTAKDQNGRIPLQFNATDSGIPMRWFAASYFLNVVPVNDPPVFTIGANVEVKESSGTVRVPNWMNQVSPGPADEANQLLTSEWIVQPPELLSATPLFDVPTGQLTLQLAPYRFGTATVSLRFRDNGGTANGGVDVCDWQSFSLVITPVNNPPSFIPGPPVVVATGSNPSYSAQWASNISAGPFETSQTVAFDVTVGNPLLFASSGYPAISPTGVLTFTVRPGAIGNTTMSVTLRDSFNAVSDTVYVSLVVSAFNGPDLIVLTLGSDYDTFSVDQFRSTVANQMQVDKSQVQVVSVTRGSVVVVFYFVGTSQRTSDQLTRDFVSLATSDAQTRTQLSIVAVEVRPQSTLGMGYTQLPPQAPAKSDSFDYVALAIGLIAAVAFVIIAVALVAAYRSRQAKKKTQQFVATKGVPPTAIVTEESNPIPREFADSGSKRVNPYEEETPQLQARENKWPRR